MFTKYHVHAWVVVCVLAACNCWGVVLCLYHFPEIVSESPVIAAGEITLVNGKPIFSVREVLKGRMSLKKLIVDVSPLGDLPAVQFTTAEKVVLFLDEPSADGSARLFGGGDQGKWPRTPTSSGAFPDILNQASIDEIIGVVRGLVRINERDGPETKSKDIREWLKSSDKIKQLLAIQYLSDDLLWPRDKRSGKIVASAHDRLDVLYSFVDDLSRLAQSDEVSIRRDAVRALRFAPIERVRPVLEKAISDSDESVRAAARAAMTRVPNENMGKTGAD